MEKILGMVNQNVQDALKKYQYTKNKEHEKTQKQIKNSENISTKHKAYKRTV
jgi:hypothetical protein